MDFQKLLNSTEYDFNRRYETGEQGGIKLYIDDSDNPEFDTEIFVDADYKHFPLRDYTDLWGTMRTVVRDYDKIGKKNRTLGVNVACRVTLLPVVCSILNL